MWPWSVPRSHPLLTAYKDEPELREEFTDWQGKVHNKVPITDQKSPWYDSFQTPPFRHLPFGGYEIRVFWHPGSDDQRIWAMALRELIRREFPELRVYEYRYEQKDMKEWPAPHWPFCIDTPTQLGAIIPFLSLKRGPLSIFVAPVTNSGYKDWTVYGKYKDFTEYGFWLGQPYPLALEYMEKRS